MPGLAKTNNFMLGTATVMIGPVADLFDLNPTDHSIGLVKNFTSTSEPGYTELPQGVKGTIVHSVLTSNPVRCTMEAYEYTSRNFMYALGLEGADTTTEYAVATTTSGAVEGGSPANTTLPVVSATGLAQGDYLMILVDNEDDFVVRQIASINMLDITVDKALPDIPSGATVRKVNRIGVGSKEDQPFYGAKIAGKLANGEPIVMLIPKIRISKGFNLAFTVDDYANLPLEFTVYDLVPTDDHYAYFNGEQAVMFRR